MSAWGIAFAGPWPDGYDHPDQLHGAAPARRRDCVQHAADLGLPAAGARSLRVRTRRLSPLVLRSRPIRQYRRLRYGFSEVSRVLRTPSAPAGSASSTPRRVYHGLSREEFLRAFRRCDLFIDRGDHRVWRKKSARVPVRVLIDPDPGYRQIKLFNDAAKGSRPPAYDAYYTYGARIADGSSPAPSAGLAWRHLFHPVDTQRLEPSPPAPDAPFTTVMNWRSHKPVRFAGIFLRHERRRIRQVPGTLPQTHARAPRSGGEGRNVPHDRLTPERLAPSQRCRSEFDADRLILDYIRQSAGEFSVVKEVYRATCRGLVQRPQRRLPGARPSGRHSGQRP